MLKWLKYITKIIFLFVMLISPKALHSQFFRYTETPIDIDANFALHSLESTSRETFFNSLTIKNNANRTESFTLNITVPQGWKVIGPEKMELQLAPFDSLIVPLRVAIGSVVRGDIGYSVIASITDNRGNTVKNEYCFVKIPREVDLSVRVLDRIAYFDPELGISEFTILCKNQGNREEPISFLFDGKNYLGIGRGGNKKFSQDVIIKPYSDSTFTFPVRLLNDEVYGRSSFGLELVTATVDTTLTTNIWFRKVDSEYLNYIPYNEKPLVVDVIGQGLLDANRKPTISTTIEGKVLFNGDNDVYYYYRNFTSRTREDFYLNNRMHIGTNLGKYQIEIGDNYRSFESNLFGRGGYFKYESETIKTEWLVNKDSRLNIDNYGGAFYYNFDPDFFVRAGGAYSINKTTDFESKLGILGGGFTLFKYHKFNGFAAINLINRELDGVRNHTEFGGQINYTSKIGRFSNQMRIRYASPLYFSPQAGRFKLHVSSHFQQSKKLRLSLYFNDNNTSRPLINNNITESINSSAGRLGRFEGVFQASPTVQVFGGPGVESFRWEGLKNFASGEYFQSIGYKFSLGARIRTTTGTTVIVPKFEIARVYLQNNPFVDNDGRSGKRAFNYQFFSLNFRSRYLNVLAFYTTGPKSVIDQINYVQFSKPNRRLQFMPAFDGFLYKDVVRGYLGVSYSNDIVSGSSFSNITGQLNWYLPHNWKIHGLLVYTIQSRTTPQDVVEKYQNLYLEAGVRKEFDFNQPRVKYHDIEFIFFKDFNGNSIQDVNEPGIKNIMVNITKESTDIIGKIPGDIYTIELLSDNLGKVYVDRIPEGRYKIQYNPVGVDAGTFTKAYGDIELHVNRSGSYFFPFVEKNKVFGKIILNRSRLSGLGKIDVSNVRITATDSQGRSFSTLTDRNGEFVLFAPVTDEYILSINNIFYENFDLRQNNFVVQFNGYKQFELNYVFDEKIRRINFATSGSELQGGVQQVRRTTISGKVQDANTLQPLRARVNLVNTRTNTVATSTYSNAISGDYTMSFIAGDDFLLEVVADDYWYLSENLVLQQITTFMNLTRDVLLRPIAVGSSVKLNISFDINSSFLAPESVAELNRLLRQIKNNPSVKLEIQGHCDDLEALQRPAVALERANAVAQYLIENGYSNIEIKGLGNTVPAASNDTEEGRERNRRIEVVVLSR